MRFHLQKHWLVYFFILWMFAATGCATTLHTKSDLYHRAYLPQEMGMMFYYTGSTNAHHHFLKTRFMHRDRKFKLARREFPLRSTFRKTTDKSQWLFITFKDGHLRLLRREGGGGYVVESIDFNPK